MIELMTSSQFTNYKKAMKEHCPDFDHGCDGTPLCADKKRIPPCIHYKGGDCTQPRILEYRLIIRNAAYERKAAKRYIAREKQK